MNEHSFLLSMLSPHLFCICITGNPSTQSPRPMPNITKTNTLYTTIINNKKKEKKPCPHSQVPSNPCSQIWRWSDCRTPHQKQQHSQQAHSWVLRKAITNHVNIHNNHSQWFSKTIYNQIYNWLQRILQTRWFPSSSIVISARPSFARNERANIFSTVSANESRFNTTLSSLTLLFFLNILNIVAIFLSVSVFSSADSSSYKIIYKFY